MDKNCSTVLRITAKKVEFCLLGYDALQSRLHNIIFQMIELFTVITVRTSNQTCQKCRFLYKADCFIRYHSLKHYLIYCKMGLKI
jgi:hypothetical protein